MKQKLQTVNEIDLCTAFKFSAKAFPFYKTILAEHGVEVEDVNNLEDFSTKVPILEKKDVFSRFTLAELSKQGEVPEFASAILSSGTSGEFSFGLISHAEVEKQRLMVDAMMQQFFAADQNPPVIINALPMGVSFVSNYAVLPTATRTDIALKAIKLLGPEKPIIVITDPHLLKKMLEEGTEQNIVWSDYQVSAVIGGTWFSDSLAQYLRGLLNSGSTEVVDKNQLFGTMGVTEVGLNLFAATPDLIMMRHAVQKNITDAKQLLGFTTKVAPTLMYCMSPNVYPEVINQNEEGVGDLVLTHLDQSVSTMLIRYATGDKARFVDIAMISAATGISAALPLPCLAILGRETDVLSPTVQPGEVKQFLFSDPERARQITGHFYIDQKEETVIVYVQLKAGHEPIALTSEKTWRVVGVPYHQFSRNMEVSYDYKWKHL